MAGWGEEPTEAPAVGELNAMPLTEIDSTAKMDAEAPQRRSRGGWSNCQQRGLQGSLGKDVGIRHGTRQDSNMILSTDRSL